MPALLAVLVFAGAGLLYAGLTGQSPKGELFAALRGEPSPPRGGPVLPSVSSTGPATAPGSSGAQRFAGVGAGPASAKGEAAVAFARQQIGKPYLKGADRMGPRGYDCSGLTFRAWEAAGVKIGQDSYAQVQDGRAVPGDRTTWRNAVAPGDLLFRVGDTPQRPNGHVSMVVDSATEIMAPRTGDFVKLAPIPWDRIDNVRRIA